jgi:hypothetical protein
MYKMSTDKYEKMKAKARSWMEKASEYENEIEKLIHDKGNEYNLLEEENSRLKHDLSDLDKSYSKLEINTERNNMRKDAEIDRLKVSLDDYKERYKEMREDNKELRKEYRKN